MIPYVGPILCMGLGFVFVSVNLSDTNEVGPLEPLNLAVFETIQTVHICINCTSASYRQPFTFSITRQPFSPKRSPFSLFSLWFSTKHWMIEGGNQQLDPIFQVSNLASHLLKLFLAHLLTRVTWATNKPGSFCLQMLTHVLHALHGLHGLHGKK